MSAGPTPPVNASSTSFRPVAWLAALTLAGWLAGARWPGLLLSLGIVDHRVAYLDSYAILASLDALRAGADVHAANPLDPLLRSHVYSDWWLGLRWLGLTRADNLLVGTVWVTAFGLTAWLTTRPRRLAETIWLALVLVSPPFLLAVKRANNDLVIFVVLAGISLAAVSAVWWRPLVALICLTLATGLKYFPAPVALAFLWSTPRSRMPQLLLLGIAVAGCALASVWPQMERARFVVDSGVYTMGAPLLWRDLGWKDFASPLPTILVIGMAGAVLAWGRITTGLARPHAPGERMRAAIGCIVLLACFSAGMSYAYRWVFVVWPSLWLWRQASDATLLPHQRWVARAACALIMVCLWGDGLLCLAVNELPPMTREQVLHIEYVVRLWTQPLHWLLMMLLAGWLIEAGRAILHEWWNQRPESGRSGAGAGENAGPA